MILVADNMAERIAKNWQAEARKFARVCWLNQTSRERDQDVDARIWRCDQISARNAAATARTILLGLLADD